MLSLIVWLAGCPAPIDGPATPPPESPDYPFGLDPNECIDGRVGIGGPSGEFVMTQEEFQPYLCASTVFIDDPVAIRLPNLQVVTVALLVQRQDGAAPIGLSLPSVTTMAGLSLEGPVDDIDVGALRGIGRLGVFDPVPHDLSAFGQLESLPNLLLVGPRSDYGGLQVERSSIVIREAENDLRGLDNFTSVDLRVFDSDLTSLRGLDNVTTTGVLEVRDTRLASLDGLDAVETSDSVTLSGVTGLQDLTGLQSLAQVGGAVELSNMDGLQSIALPALTTLQGDLIVQNTATTALWLPRLTEVSGDIIIADNPLLPACEVEQLVRRLQLAGFTGASENRGNDTSATCDDEMP